MCVCGTRFLTGSISHVPAGPILKTKYPPNWETEASEEPRGAIKIPKKRQRTHSVWSAPVNEEWVQHKALRRVPAFSDG